MNFSKPISVPAKEAVTLTTELSVTGIYIGGSVNMIRKVIQDKGTDKEKVFSEDPASTNFQLSFEGDKVGDVLTIDLVKEIEKAIEAVKERYK